jgi:hypothetical protein
MCEVNGTGPPGDGNGAPRPGKRRFIDPKTTRAYHSSEFSANGHLAPGTRMRAFPDGDLVMVRTLVGSAARTDKDIPVALRVLIRASARLRNDNLRIAVLAAERAFLHFSIHGLPEYRDQCWQHVGIALQWVVYLQRNRTGRASQSG